MIVPKLDPMLDAWLMMGHSYIIECRPFTVVTDINIDSVTKCGVCVYLYKGAVTGDNRELMGCNIEPADTLESAVLMAFITAASKGKVRDPR